MCKAVAMTGQYPLVDIRLAPSYDLCTIYGIYNEIDAIKALVMQHTKIPTLVDALPVFSVTYF